MSEERIGRQQLRELAQAAPHKDWRAGNYYGKPFLADIEVLADTPEGLMVVMQGNQNLTEESVAAIAFVGAASPATVLALLDEIDRLTALVIERETIRIGQSLQRRDDQKQIDDLVALGIQQDKDEIAILRAKNERLAYEARFARTWAEMTVDKEVGRAATEALAYKMECEQLKAENAELIDLMRSVVAEHPRRPDKNDGNGPGHGHAVPGVWDEDNGELAGKPCAWCSIWNAAKGIVERHEQAMTKEQP